MRHFSHLSYYKRLRIENLLKEKVKPCEIAKILNVHNSTIYRELKRGRYIHLDTHLQEVEGYSPIIAEESYRNNLTNKGVSIKLGKHHEFAKYIEDKIVREHYSPKAVLGEIKMKKLFQEVSICTTTVYNYIKKDVFSKLEMKKLPMPRRKKKRKIVPRKWINLKGTTIEERDKSILSRKEFGHWEMDSVIGKRNKKVSLLVLTERKTRMELIFKLKEKNASNVVKMVNRIERKLKSKFSKIFKTITVDNGIEFSYFNEIEKSCLYAGKRTKLYYCHPYSSFERGSNENANRLIRRWIPKYTDFTNISEKKIREIENWINHYPREILNYDTSFHAYQKELEKI
ncbi:MULTISPECIES: IS30 family transposase [Terrabacteria group]|uniref:IS30 family transposase n=1 Tax=Bacillati TaxID=1783272 RepID=UPI001C6F5272|nr:MULTISPECIES: IS30 family transposase [Terrabacteria group]